VAESNNDFSKKNRPFPVSVGMGKRINDMKDDQGELFQFGKHGELRGMVRNNDHSTSISAAQSIVKFCKTKLQKEVYDALAERSMTDEELEQLPRFSHYGQTTVSKRRTELYHAGLIEFHGTRMNSRGSMMKVWQIKL